MHWRWVKLRQMIHCGDLEREQLKVQLFKKQTKTGKIF